MDKIKHSKFQNTYLVYQFLVRKTTEDAMAGVPIKESKAFKIIHKHFSKGILRDEFSVYTALLETQVPSRYGAETLITDSLKIHSEISTTQLKKARYSLIKDIKESYDIEKLFSTRVDDYKNIASAYILLEANTRRVIPTKAKFMSMFVESVTRPKLGVSKATPLMSVINKTDATDRKLMIGILTEEFNQQFSHTLNEDQKKFIRDFIMSNTDESNWFNEHVVKIKSTTKKRINEIQKKTQTEDNKVLCIKLTECVKRLDSLLKKKIHNHDDHVKVMNFYKLLEYV
jgi:hypothetical protein